MNPILQGIGRLLQHSATNDLKHRLELKLTKVLAKMECRADEIDVSALTLEILGVIGDWSQDGIDLGKQIVNDVLPSAMPSQRRVMKRPR